MDQLWNSLHTQFVGGGLILLLSGAILALCRKVPEYLWKIFLRQFTVRLTLTNSEAGFEKVNVWLNNQRMLKKARVVGVFRSNTTGAVLFRPGPGNHFFFHSGRPVWLSYQRERREVLNLGTRSPRMIRIPLPFSVDHKTQYVHC